MNKNKTESAVLFFEITGDFLHIRNRMSVKVSHVLQKRLTESLQTLEDLRSLNQKLSDELNEERQLVPRLGRRIVANDETISETTNKVLTLLRDILTSNIKKSTKKRR